MAFLRGSDGRTYNVPDNILQQFAVSEGAGDFCDTGDEGGGGPLVIVQIIGGARGQVSGGPGGGGVQAYSHCGWRNCSWRNRGRCRSS